jgi:hypothetical protein
MDLAAAATKAIGAASTRNSGVCGQIIRKVEDESAPYHFVYFKTIGCALLGLTKVVYVQNGDKDLIVEIPGASLITSSEVKLLCTS